MDVVQLIVSSSINSDGQSLFQFQLNEEESDVDMETAERFYDDLTCLACHDHLDSHAKLRTHMAKHRVTYCELCCKCLLGKGSYEENKLKSLKVAQVKDEMDDDEDDGL